MTGFPLRAYLDRLGLPRAAASSERLARLQTAQIRRIPFENIDPLHGIEPRLGSPEVADKILSRGRGGYCFELNRLFRDALEAQGFAVERRLARVRMGAAEGGARTHLALVCTVDGQSYLTDAGFGGPAPLTPLRLEPDREQDAPNGTYVLRHDPGTGELVLCLRRDDGDFALYGFDDAHAGDTDIAAANFLCCTWHASPFPTHLMVNGYDGDTRIGLFDRQMTEDGRKSTLRDAEGLGHVLRRRLALKLDPGVVADLWQRLPQPETEPAL